MIPETRLSPVSAAACAALLGFAAACSSPPRDAPERVRVGDEMQRSADAAFVREPFDDQARLAVLRQRVLVDHHFEPFSTRLTPLGQRDLGWLAEAVRRDGGSISLPRGGCSESLHEARVLAVREGLLADGIAADRIEIDSSPPGGRGVSTAAAILIRARIERNPLKVPDSSSSGSTITSTTTGGSL